LALLLKLSYNYQNQVQINAVLVQQEKVDRVGVEPTTSAQFTSLFARPQKRLVFLFCIVTMTLLLIIMFVLTVIITRR
jgi:hypothetical protein